MADTRSNIVIVGASYAGLSTAHYFLKHVQPSLPKDGKYHVYLIDPSTHMYHRVAAPRAAASSEWMPDSKVFHDIPAGFKHYSKDIFTFIQGKATSLDIAQRIIRIQRTQGDEESLSYHSLVLATGTKSFDPTLSSQGTSHEDIKKALRNRHSQLKIAKSVVIAGGGPAGVETAGEVGELLNGAAGWFASSPSNPKATVTLLAGGDRLLPILRPAIAKQAETYLKRVGVNTVYSDKVAKTETLPSGQTQLTLESGKQMEVDVYIPATGVLPMTEYMPKELLTERGYIKTNEKTLRVDEAGPRVYAVGDVGSYTRGGILDMFEAIPVLLTNMKSDLLAEGGKNGKIQDRVHTPLTAESQLVPVGRSKGVGAFNGNKLPSMMVYMIKGRDYMAATAPDIVSGNKWKKENGWKPRDG